VLQREVLPNRLGKLMLSEPAIASLAAGIAMVVASGLGLNQASLRAANGRS